MNDVGLTLQTMEYVTICAVGLSHDGSRDVLPLRLICASGHSFVSCSCCRWLKCVLLPRDMVVKLQSETSEDADVQHNIWNKILDIFTLQGSSLLLQYDLEDRELCRIALSCHFALDVIYAFTA